MAALSPDTQRPEQRSHGHNEACQHWHGGWQGCQAETEVEGNLQNRTSTATVAMHMVTKQTPDIMQSNDKDAEMASVPKFVRGHLKVLQQCKAVAQVE